MKQAEDSSSLIKIIININVKILIDSFVHASAPIFDFQSLAIWIPVQSYIQFKIFEKQVLTTKKKFYIAWISLDSIRYKNFRLFSYLHQSTEEIFTRDPRKWKIGFFSMKWAAIEQESSRTKIQKKVRISQIINKGSSHR